MMSDKMCALHKVAWALLIIGGLNWGLVGVLKWNLVEKIFGGVPVLVTVIYILVGLSAIAMLGAGKCKSCKK